MWRITNLAYSMNLYILTFQISWTHDLKKFEMFARLQSCPSLLGDAFLEFLQFLFGDWISADMRSILGRNQLRFDAIPRHPVIPREDRCLRCPPKSLENSAIRGSDIDPHQVWLEDFGCLGWDFCCSKDHLNSSFLGDVKSSWNIYPIIPWSGFFCGGIRSKVLGWPFHPTYPFIFGHLFTGLFHTAH